MPLNLRSRDLGELVAFALFGLPPLGLILVGYFTGGPGSQQLQRTLGIFLACLIFFGAGVDLLHQMASESRFNRWVGTLEDGGEMVVVSLLVAFLFNRLRAPTQGDPLAAA
jgi:hypothetical protein